MHNASDPRTPAQPPIGRHPARLPRLLNPRLPIGRRWTRFCRCPFARELRTAARGTFATLAAFSAAVTFVVAVNATASVYELAGGTL